MADEPLERVAEVEQSPGGGGGEVAAPQLEHAEAREGQERERRRVAPGPRGEDLERGEEAEDPAELLERAVVAEVGDVGAEVVDGRPGADGLELAQRLEAGGDVVEADRVEAQGDGAVEQLARVGGHEADEQVEVAVAGDRRRGPGAGRRHWDRARVWARAAWAEVGVGEEERRVGGEEEETDTAALPGMIGVTRGGEGGRKATGGRGLVQMCSATQLQVWASSSVSLGFGSFFLKKVHHLLQIHR